MLEVFLIWMGCRDDCSP